MASSSSSSFAETIKVLSDRAVDLLIEPDPLYAPIFGIKKFEDEAFNVSLPYRLEWLDRCRDILAEVKAFETQNLKDLSEQDKADLRFLKYALEKPIENEGIPGEKGYAVELEESHMSGNIMQLEMGFAGYQPASTPEDFANYKVRLSKLPSRFDHIIDNFRIGIKRGITLPLVSIDLLIKKCASSSCEGLEGEKLDEALLNNPMAKREEAKKVMGDERYLLEDLKTSIVPAFAKVKKFLEEEYRQHARKSDGIYGLEGYKEAYEAYIFKHCSTRYNADEIHELGLKEVARVQARMEEAKNLCGFEGTIKEFQNAINDRERYPQLYFEKPDEEVIPFYQEIMGRAVEKMKDYFERFPKFECKIVEVPKNMEMQLPLALYMPGTPEKPGEFKCNMRLHRTKPRHVAVAICLHEAMPGHHHQLSLALENKDQHVIRKMIFETAYAEGYGLYCEYLGEELGFYSDPFDLFGRLECEMQRACRLVVDSGVHAKGWSVEEGVEYMMKYLSLPREEILTEVRRYCVYPGQALSYKVGEIKIRELRSRAEKELGERFGIKEFHAVLLDQGSVPLGVLEEAVEAYIASKKSEE
ncbi:hypothetical protein HDU97_006621 [Phlyctochytrium planicorne]|nr:hypothetical protein HDU97_006621 [Phlyctochytrium planicorne]